MCVLEYSALYLSLYLHSDGDDRLKVGVKVSCSTGCGFEVWQALDPRSLPEK